MIDVGYAHSKITDAVLTRAHDSRQIDLQGVIYTRGYRGFFGKNTLCLYESTIPYKDEVKLISYAYQVARYFDLLPCDKIRLFLPTHGTVLSRLICAHHKVQEVFYIEEGDLSYLPSEQIQKAEAATSIADTLQLAAYILPKLGFDIEKILLGDGPWLSDVYGKYRGVIASKSDAFFGFPGERIDVEIPKLNIFNDKAGLILVNYDQGIVDILKGWVSDYGLKFEEKHLAFAVRRSIQKFIEAGIDEMLPYAQSIVIKKHPLVTWDHLEFVDPEKSKVCADWAETDLEYLTRKAELGHINFHCFYSVGESSVTRYADDGKSKSNVILIKNERIAQDALAFLLEAMESVRNSKPELPDSNGS